MSVISSVERSSAGTRIGVAAVNKAVDAVIAWRARARERRHLARLDDRMLRDIGLSRADVERECRRPFWHI